MKLLPFLKQIAVGLMLTFSSHGDEIAQWGLSPAAPSVSSGMIQVTAGTYHTASLDQYGGVRVWAAPVIAGLNLATPPAGLTDVVGIDAGAFCMYALKADGTVVHWGDNYWGQGNVPTDLANVVAISGGGNHVMALLANSTVRCWGSNAEHQLDVPAAIQKKVMKISAGGLHSLALGFDRKVYAWGDNTWGACNVPTALTNVVEIAAGLYHSLALRDDGTVVAWGRNDSGQATVPAGLTNVVAVSAGDGGSLALKADGSVQTWGSNSYGQGTIPAGLTGVGLIASGASHHVAIKYDGFARVLGLRSLNASVGVAGFHHRFARIWTPSLSVSAGTLPPGMAVDPVTGILSGTPTKPGRFRFSIAGWYWDLFVNGTGVVGGYDSAVYPQPTDLGSLTALDAGYYHVLALQTDGKVRSWGYNSFGQTTVPTTLSDVVAVSAGREFSTALKRDGTLASWGTSFPLNVSSLQNVARISAGTAHLLALREDGTVAAVGLNSFGETVVPLGLHGVVAVSAGGWYSLALKSDGKVVAWGTNSYGLVSEAESLTDVIAIAAGRYRAAALRRDGKVRIWGDVNKTTEPGYVAIDLEGGNLLGLKADGTVRSLAFTSREPTGMGAVAIAAGESFTSALLGAEEPTIRVIGEQKAVIGAAGTQPGAEHRFYYRITATGSPTSYAATGLPSGLTLNTATGLISGLPTVAGIFPVGLTATDGARSGSGSLTIYVDGKPTISPPPAQTILGMPMSLQLTATNMPTSWSADNLPLGMILDSSTGLITGRTEVVGTISVLLHATNTFGTTEYAWNLQVSNPQITSVDSITFAATAAEAAGTEFNYRIVGTGGATIFGATGLPTGLTLDAATGIIRGHVDAPGTYAVTVTASNGFATATRVLTIVIDGLPKIITSNWPNQTTMQPFIGQIAASGNGVITATGLPPGVLVSPMGVVSGRATMHGSYAMTLRTENIHGSTEKTILVKVGNLLDLTYGTTIIVPAPRQIATGSYTKSLVVGQNSSLAYLYPSAGDAALPATTNVRSVEQGVRHALMVLNDGTVKAFGENDAGQTTVPPGLTNVVAVAAGWRHSLALLKNGTVLGWGANREPYYPYKEAGQSSPPAGLSEVVAITAGDYFSAALRSNGKVVVWGLGSVGNLMPPNDLSDVVAISAGSAHILALRRNGTVVAWGDNAYGQSTVPSGLENVVAISTFSTKSFALKADGTVVAWAANPLPANLQGVISLASGGTDNVLAGSGPAAIISPDVAITAAAGLGSFYHRIVSIGSPTSYSVTGLPTGLTLDATTGIITGAATQLGEFRATLTAHTPGGDASQQLTIVVNGSPEFLSTTLPLLHLGVPSPAIVYAAGSPTFTATGLPPGVTMEADGVISGSPTLAGHYTASVTISNPFGTRTANFSIAVNCVIAWGDVVKQPLEVPAGLADVTKIAAGDLHMLALKRDGTVVGWGDNRHGQATVPGGVSNVVDIAAGNFHSVLLKADGTVQAWGDNSVGQTTVPAALANVASANVVSIASGGTHTLAVKKDGTVVAWGNNFYGQSVVPLDLADVIAVAGGNNYSMALLSDGNVRAWGLIGSSGGASLLNENIVEIEGGGSLWIALRADGTVLDSQSFNYRVSNTLQNGANVQAGGVQSLVLKSDGQVVTWSYGGYGVEKIPAGIRAVGIAAGSSFSAALLSGGGAPIITSPLRALANAAGTRPFRYQIQAGNAPATTYSAAGLPAGLSLNSTTGLISGIPLQVGSFTFAVTASNAAGTDSIQIRLEVFGATRLLPAPVARQYLAQDTDGVIAAAGNPTFSATGLPPGFTLHPTTGKLQGRATASGNFTANVTVSNAFGTETQAIPIQVFSWKTRDNIVITNPVAEPNAAECVTAVAAGAGAFFALKNDGTVLHWGAPGSAPPSGLQDVVQIEAGPAHAAALRANGTVVCWGGNGEFQVTPPAGLVGVVAVSCGSNHTVALKQDGTVVAWGGNTSGQSTVPSGLTGVVDVKAGNYFSWALKADNSVVAWGYSPSTLPGNAIMLGDSGSLALNRDGTLWRRYDGTASLPFGITALVGETPLNPDGTLDSTFKWRATGTGDVSSGGGGIVLAHPSEAPLVNAPRNHFRWDVSHAAPLRLQVTPRSTATTFAASGLPTGLTLNSSTGLISGKSTVIGTHLVTLNVTAAAGTLHRILRLTLYGTPSFPQGPSRSYLVGSPISETLAWNGTVTSDVAMPAGLTLNTATGLIAGTPTNPGKTVANLSVTSASGETASQNFTLDVTNIWGGGQGVPADLEAVQVASGSSFKLAIKPDRTVTAWGNANSPNIIYFSGGGYGGGGWSTELTRPAGLTAVPPDLADVIQVSAGGYHAVALKANGQLVTWGSNTMPAINRLEYTNQASNPGFSTILAVASGDYHSIALTKSGAVVGWGSDYTIGDGSVGWPLVRKSQACGGPTSGAVAIAALGNYSQALMSDGTITTWGDFNPPSAGSLQPVDVVAITGRLALQRNGILLIREYYSSWSVVDTNVVAVHENLYLKADGTTKSASSSSYQPPNGLVTTSGTTGITTHPGKPMLVTMPYVRWEFGNPRDFYYRIATVPVSTSYSITGLAPGLALDATTGIISGRAIVGGSFNPQITATAAGGSNTFPLRIHIDGVAKTYAGSAIIKIGQFYTSTPLGANFQSVTAEGLPPGITLNSATGVLSGTPPTAGHYPVQLTFLGGDGQTLLSTHQLTVTNVWAWGEAPTLPSGAAPVIKISASGSHAAFLLANGTMVTKTAAPSHTNLVDVATNAEGLAFGLKSDGTVVPTPASGPITNVIAIEGGQDHFLALKSDGTVVAWNTGFPQYGHTTVPPDLSEVISIAAGRFNSHALKSNGTVVSWGLEGWGVVGLGQFQQGLAKLTSGDYVGLGLKSDGTLSQWGNVYGLPSNLGKLATLAGGHGHFLARRLDGQFVAWGDNSKSQTNWPVDLPNTASGLAAGGSTSYAWTGLSITSPLTANGQNSIPFSIQIHASWQGALLAATNLPSGLQLHASGLISGTPSQTGVFEVTLQASLAGQTATQTLQIAVAPAPADAAAALAAYQAWRDLHFATTDPAGAPGLDADADGVPNLIEFLAGTAPTSVAAKPELRVFINAQQRLVISMNVLANMPSIDLQGQFSFETQFGSATSIAPPTFVSGAPAGMIRVDFVDAQPLSTSPRRFARIKAMLP